MVDKVRINYIDSAHLMTCSLNKALADHFKIKNETENIILRLGSLDLEVEKIVINDDDPDIQRLSLSEDIKNKMHIPENTILQIKKIGDNHLELGPFIGVFINFEKVELLRSGKGITAYTQFTNACKSMYGLCCFFSIENIDMKNKSIEALVKHNSKWNTYTLPLPIVIYDRNVENNCRVESIALRQQLGSEFHILNSMAKIAKWETIVALRKNQNLIPLISNTTVYHSIDDIKNSLKNSPSVYLKPDSLSKGKGIFRITSGKIYKYIL